MQTGGAMPGGIHFLLPKQLPMPLQDLLELPLDKGYPYWIGGSANWVIQTYRVLRQFREGLSIDSNARAGEVNVARVTCWRERRRRAGEYRVSIRADYRRLWDIDFELLQNPTAVQHGRQAYVTYWPVPGLIPREKERKVVNVAYAGRINSRNIASPLRANAGRTYRGFNLQIIDKQQWHDMSQVDILLGIRSFSKKAYPDKPPSKLLNAWHAGIPLVAGWDSAFSAIGTPGVDYIRVSTEAEMWQACERLRDDPAYYQSIVAAGRRKAGAFTHDSIAQEWLALLDGPIRGDWEAWRQPSTVRAGSRFANHLTDQLLDGISVIKGKVRRVPSV